MADQRRRPMTKQEYRQMKKAKEKLRRQMEREAWEAARGPMDMPFFLLAIYEKNGQPLEKAAANIIRVIFIRPKKRPYKIDNFYSLLGRQNTLEKEVAHIVANGQKNRELLLPPVWDGRQAKRCGVGDKDGKKRRKKTKKAVKCR